MRDTAQALAGVDAFVAPQLQERRAEVVVADPRDDADGGALTRSSDGCVGDVTAVARQIAAVVLLIELDQRLADWTGSRSCEEVMRVLQDAGVPAGRVSDARDLSEDPQLAARGHSLRVEHPAIGPMSVESPAFRLSRSPVGVARPAPRLGEHNERVFREFLGLSGPEFATLETAGVFE